MYSFVENRFYMRRAGLSKQRYWNAELWETLRGSAVVCATFSVPDLAVKTGFPASDRISEVRTVITCKPRGVFGKVLHVSFMVSDRKMVLLSCEV